MAGFTKEQSAELDERFDRVRREIVTEVTKSVQTMLEDQRSAIMVDVRTLLEQELRPIRDQLEELKMNVEQLSVRSTEDVAPLYEKVASLERKVAGLERQLAQLQTNAA